MLQNSLSGILFSFFLGLLVGAWEFWGGVHTLKKAADFMRKTRLLHEVVKGSNEV